MKNVYRNRRKTIQTTCIKPKKVNKKGSKTGENHEKNQINKERVQVIPAKRKKDIALAFPKHWSISFASDCWDS